MPVAKGKTQVGVHLPDAVNQQLSVLAEKEEFQGSKSQVIEAALLHYIEGRSDNTLMVSLHDHLANVQASLIDALHTLHTTLKEQTHALQTLQTDHDNLIARFTQFERASQTKHDSLLRAYDALKEGLSSQPGGIKKLFGMG